jgi:hypothetical protein
VGLLLLPLLAMQFTSEVNWTRSDFVIFGIMLLLACITYELAVRASGNKAYRLAAGIAVLGVFFQIWANLAVGIIGNENNPANLMFLIIPAVGVLGAILARFEARGMVRTLNAMAITQVLIALLAWVFAGANILVMTGLFVLLWLTSAALFRKAALSG